MSIYPKVEIRQYAGQDQNIGTYSLFDDIDLGFIKAAFWIRRKDQAVGGSGVDCSPYWPAGSYGYVIFVNAHTSYDATLTYTEGASTVRVKSVPFGCVAIIPNVKMSAEIVVEGGSFSSGYMPFIITCMA